MSFKKKMAFTACSLLLAGQVVHADDPTADAMDYQDLGSGSNVRAQMVQTSKSSNLSDATDGTQQQPPKKKAAEGSCGQAKCGASHQDADEGSEDSSDDESDGS